MRQADVIVLGGGAAGLMCALTAGQAGADVVVIDHAKKLGTKILIAGGGRCNFTNLEVAPERFICANPHFPKSALSRYTQWDFIDLVQRHGVPYHEKKLGQLFCDDTAQRILDLLLAECAAGGVDFITGEAVTAVEGGERFRVATEQHHVAAPRLVIATGAPSVPKTGATGFAYDLARQFGLGIVEPRPGLVPLRLAEDTRPLAKSLSGVAVPSEARSERMAFHENVLFTHRGVSGPAVLQASSYWRPGEPLTLDLLPDVGDPDHLVARKRARPRAELKTVLGEVLPNRMAERLCDHLLGNARLGQLKDKELRRTLARLKQWTLTPEATEGYAKAEVTVGGIATDELNQRTMEAHKVPGLHVIGEAVDVTGWLGGYNFQWAWSSGWAAGHAAAN
ncbi:hypothetical protein SAMN05216241_11326 [Limimonas halophila]|uniref:Aminoacetone oxidase family FAD-binding enzyme n=1 Tax=Limimonas halophila TaxID=1082479 RepID=A0A1G7UB04_9PROT|nr:NAD(P)/FAD-dependent oxidoreductase [Limimonas halophila]SDG44634.1 hypothetical protein SAMN05216241_11326 [Limimonas halophila]